MIDTLEVSPTPSKPQIATNTTIPKRIRIFLVDDSQQFLGVAKRFLQMQPSYEVVGSSNSIQQAFAQISLTQPDLVIIDLVMPGMNGLEAARRLKKQSASVRVIVVSLQDEDEYADSAEVSGADGFIAKTDFCEKLVPFIDTLFKNPSMQHSPSFTSVEES